MKKKNVLMSIVGIIIVILAAFFIIDNLDSLTASGQRFEKNGITFQYPDSWSEANSVAEGSVGAVANTENPGISVVIQQAPAAYGNDIQNACAYNDQFLAADGNYINIEEKNINEKLDNKIACEEKLEYLYEQKKELEELNKIINLAKETLEESYDEIKKNITPKFTKELSNNIEMISDGKYKKANFNTDTGLTIEAENGEYIECNKLSIGTIDQLYLSLRLSATKEITKETIPIILDESFAYFDNQRLENVIKYLDSNYNNQIIIFTCTNREKEILDKLNIEYNLVNL